MSLYSSKLVGRMSLSQCTPLREYPSSQINTWGYSTVNFFAPMSRYASAGGGPRAARREFKEMVKRLHKAGIEVREREGVLGDGKRE